jgi:hypothetical protein
MPGGAQTVRHALPDPATLIRAVDEYEGSHVSRPLLFFVMLAKAGIQLYYIQLY